MHKHPRRGPRSGIAAVTTLLAILATATACGSDSDSDDKGDDKGDKSSQGLSAEQLEDAVLSSDNFTDDWEETEPDDDEEDSEGCLAEIDTAIDALETVDEAQSKFEYGEQGIPALESSVTTYADQDALLRTFDEYEKTVRECTSLKWEDEDGIAFDLTLSQGEDLPLGDIEIDDQISIVIEGTFTVAGESTPLYLYTTQVMAGPTLTNVATSSLSDYLDEHREYATIAAERLAAVAAGDTPEVAVGP